MTSVLLITLMGQPRILLAMARDGLLPPIFGRINSRGVPAFSTSLTGVFVCFASSLIPLSVLVELVSIGTLMAFFIVCLSVFILRRTRPDLPRKFKVPCYPVFPILGAVFCLVLMLSLRAQNWLRLVVWWAIGMVIYYFYGRVQGRINRPDEIDFNNVNSSSASNEKYSTLHEESGGEGSNINADNYAPYTESKDDLASNNNSNASSSSSSASHEVIELKNYPSASSSLSSASHRSNVAMLAQENQNQTVLPSVEEVIAVPHDEDDDEEEPSPIRQMNVSLRDS
jgi:hypothetical protein